MEEGIHAQSGLLFVIEALERVQCIVKQMQFAVDEMYNNDQKMKIPSNYQNLTLELQPIEISMTSLNQYLLQNSIKADNSLVNAEVNSKFVEDKVDLISHKWPN